MSNLAAAAVRYNARGVPIFPCWPRTKEPLTAHGFHDASADEEQVRAWWLETPDANIGCCPGRPGWIVFDIDGPDAEHEAQRLGLYAEPTLHVLTSRGRHLYFLHPGGEIGNRKLGRLDVRADKGYVLLPPSVHPSGGAYRALGTFADIRRLPPRAEELLKATRPLAAAWNAPSTINAGTPRRRAYVIAAIEAECIELAHTGEGDRNNALNRAAYSLSRFVATEEAFAGPIVDALTIAARHAGLEEEEIRRTIESAFKARGAAA